MIEVRTSELEGLPLNWAVAQALGFVTGEAAYCDPAWLLDGKFVASKHRWRPSTDWSQGGPLIDKYRIAFDDGITDFYACCEGGDGYGMSHLIAACRAIVAAKLGDVVQVPTELVQGGAA